VKIKLPESMSEIMSIAWDAEMARSIEQESQAMESRFITLSEFQSRAEVTDISISRWIKNGKLQVEKINNIDVVRADGLLRMPNISLANEVGNWEHQGGTIQKLTKEMLQQHALGGNMSFTIDLGVRLVLACFGLIPLKFVLPGIAKIANRHPIIRETFAKQTDLLSAFADSEHNLIPSDEYV